MGTPAARIVIRNHSESAFGDRGERMNKENYPYAFAPALIEQLDTMVRDPSDSDYMALREEMLSRMNRAEVKNPFHAGAPAKYEEEHEEKALFLKAKGLTTRQIAAEIGCSQSTVVRLLNRRWTRKY